MRVSKLITIVPLTQGMLTPKVRKPLTLESPAIDVLKEAGEDKGLKLRAGLSVDIARQILTETHRLTALVVDRQQRVVGCIALADLESVKVLTIAARLGLVRSELTLQDLMVPVHKLLKMSVASSLRATVRDVLHSLKKASKAYLLVLDETDEGLVGYFSVQEIAHKLGVDIAMDLVPSTLDEVVDVMEHPH